MQVVRGFEEIFKKKSLIKDKLMRILFLTCSSDDRGE